MIEEMPKLPIVSGKDAAQDFKMISEEFLIGICNSLKNAQR
jgi:hypothetical protein